MKKRLSRLEVNVIMRKFKVSVDNFIINDDNKLDVAGNVKILRCSNDGYLPLKFAKVLGSFNCSGIGLMSLKGCPVYVGKDFDCSNNKLISLKFGPKYVGNSYNCNNNRLVNLFGCATEIGLDFNCKMNKLKSLQGSPQKVNGRFDCSNNLLNNLIGSPRITKGEMYVYSNFLKNLRGCGDFEGGIFIDSTTSSINTGQINNDMRLILKTHSKFTNTFLPYHFIKYSNYLSVVFKYQYHFEIWTDDDELVEENFLLLIEDIKDGLL